MNTLPTEVEHAVSSYLASADRLLPGAVTDLAVVGSTALGAYRPGASDIDLVAVLDDSWRGRRGLLPRLRLLHLSQLSRLFGRIVRGKGVSATCNTAYIWGGERTLPVTQIRPAGSHVGEIFNANDAFDVNPAMWNQLAADGIVVRGKAVADWGIDQEPEKLQPWTRQNLHDYWTPLAEKVTHGRLPLLAGRVEWSLLGPARMHATLTTGKVISKDAAGEYALERFPEHAPILHVGLGHLRGEDIPSNPPRGHWRELTVAAMKDLINDAVG